MTRLLPAVLLLLMHGGASDVEAQHLARRITCLLSVVSVQTALAQESVIQVLPRSEPHLAGTLLEVTSDFQEIQHPIGSADLGTENPRDGPAHS